MTLARNGAVAVVRRDDEEIVTRVTLAGSALAPTVALFAADAEWECDCGSPLDACEHVAASVIACRQGSTADPDSLAIDYRLRRERTGWFFERGVVDGGTFHPIDVPLQALAAGTFRGPPVSATALDLEIEKALGGKRRGVLDSADLRRLFGVLRKSDRVTVDGRKARVSPEPIKPLVAVEDADGGFRVSLVQHDEERDADADVDVIRPEADIAWTARERDDLLGGRVYRTDDDGE